MWSFRFVVAFALFFSTSYHPSLLGAQTSAPSHTSALKGLIGSLQTNGSFVVPDKVLIYVMYAGPVNHDPSRRDNWSEFAGNQYTKAMNSNPLISPDQTKKIMKDKNLTDAEKADSITTQYLQSVDDALAVSLNRIKNHPQESWQIKTLAPEEHGLWSLGNLLPGSYMIVCRGTVAQQDADWEAEVDLAPDKTISLPLAKPRFIRIKQ
jgi:hypothetical protein